MTCFAGVGAQGKYISIKKNRIYKMDLNGDRKDESVKLTRSGLYINNKFVCKADGATLIDSNPKDKYKELVIYHRDYAVYRYTSSAKRLCTWRGGEYGVPLSKLISKKNHKYVGWEIDMDASGQSITAGLQLSPSKYSDDDRDELWWNMLINAKFNDLNYRKERKAPGFSHGEQSGSMTICSRRGFV